MGIFRDSVKYEGAWTSHMSISKMDGFFGTMSARRSSVVKRWNYCYEDACSRFAYSDEYFQEPTGHSDKLHWAHYAYNANPCIGYPREVGCDFDIWYESERCSGGSHFHFLPEDYEVPERV